MGNADIINRFSKSAKNGGIVAISTLILAGCDEIGKFNLGHTLRGNNPADAPSHSRQTTKTTERDVEAPEVFSATENGLWDGRPSLGGVWVAHPDVKEPERVIIRNKTNSNFVVGALFRRARDIPGPRLQISSDAADALGMLAGAPAKLDVTALRKEQVASEAPEMVDTVSAPTEVSETSLDPIASAAAAIEAAAPTATAVETAAATAPAPRPTNSSLEKPFIQLGIFSVEANATHTGQQMRNAGLVPMIKRGERSGKPFWRVVVGPASNKSERSALLEKIKGEDFSDVYAITN